MARAVERAWPGVDLSGVVVTRDGHAVVCDRVEVLEASHPVPDARSKEAARRILAAVQGLGPEDMVLALNHFRAYQTLQRQQDQTVANWIADLERRVPDATPTSGSVATPAGPPAEPGATEEVN